MLNVRDIFEGSNRLDLVRLIAHITIKLSRVERLLESSPVSVSEVLGSVESSRGVEILRYVFQRTPNYHYVWTENL